MAFRAGRWRVRQVSAWLAPAMALLVLAGCGAAQYTYVTNSEDRTYLRIPATWQQIDERSLQDALGIDPTVDPAAAGFWLQGYDADASPSAAHLVGPHAEAPALFVSVQQVPPAARGQVSLDYMRDVFYPVSPSGQEQLAQNPASPFTGFTVMDDEVLTPGDGLRGVHSVYKFRLMDGPVQVFDQIVYTNDDASKIYIFFVRCSAECYEQRQQEIGNVVSSFTVRES
jgi:hypothetical protein